MRPFVLGVLGVLAMAATPAHAQNWLESKMIGAMCGAQESPARTLAVIGHAADSFVKHAYQSGFSSAAAARGLVEGAAEWAEKCSLDERIAANAAAQGAADAADDLNPSIGRKVRAALTEGLIAGGVVTLKKAAAPTKRF